MRQTPSQSGIDRKIFISEDQSASTLFPTTSTSPTSSLFTPTPKPTSSTTNIFTTTPTSSSSSSSSFTPTPSLFTQAPTAAYSSIPTLHSTYTPSTMDPSSNMKFHMAMMDNTPPYKKQQPLPPQCTILPPLSQILPRGPSSPGGEVQLPSIQNMLQPPKLPVFDPRRFDPKTMYYKPIWTQKRENKFIGLWYRSLAYSFTREVLQQFLKAFRYFVTDAEAVQFLSTLHRDKAGHVSAVELRLAFQEFVVRYPKMRDTKKYYKPHYLDGYNWLESPYFPRKYIRIYSEYHNKGPHQGHPQFPPQKQQYQYQQNYRPF